MEDIKTFEEVRCEMEAAYDDYLRTGEEDRLLELCHQVMSNALFILNEDEVEDIFNYDFPDEMLENKNGVIHRLLNTNVGLICRVSTIPCEGVVWLTSETGQEYDDDDQELAVWEIYNIAVALYKMTEPLAYLLYN